MIAESNETLIAKKVIRVLDCSSKLQDDELCSMWNFTRCPSDKDYCNPYIPGDILYFQQSQTIPRIEPSPGSQNFFVSYPTVINTATGLPYDFPVTIEEGTDESGNRIYYRNFIIDTSELTLDCFYLKVESFFCKLKGDTLIAYNQCVEDLINQGKTELEAQSICLKNYCQPVTFYSEPYCKVCYEHTIMLEGIYPGKDCDGVYYAEFAGGITNSYKAQIRIVGEITSTQFDIAEVKVNKKKKSTTLTENFTLYSKLLPYYAARKMAFIFAAQETYVDGVLYENAVTVPKGTEEGSMWPVKTNLQRVCNTTNFTCEE